MNGLKGWCAVLDVRPHGESPESVKVLRLTLPHELPGERREQAKQKPVGKAFAMVANRSSNGHSLASECVKSNEGDEEIIKVPALDPEGMGLGRGLGLENGGVVREKGSQGR
ncbi:tuftelin-like, partial [Corapipo altera]|uniref:tuftelin-like n=1 Tax=Corapipo altera TaxID=415028 RepID=UPI000FD68D6F